MEDEKILLVGKSKDEYRCCNVCGKRMREAKQELGKVEMNDMNEIVLGKNNRSMSIAICDECLGEFADKLWEYLSKAN